MVLRNSIANLIGQLVYPILSFLLVPLYLRYVGLEGYGLIGFFTTLTVLLGVVSKGTGAALQREIAQRVVADPPYKPLRPLVGTFELAYWLAGIVLCGILLSVSGFVSSRWVKLEAISPEVVRMCLFIMSLRIALTFPSGVYQAVLMGTERQVLANLLSFSFALANAISGAIIVVVSRSVVGFYLSDLAISSVSLLVLRFSVGKILPPRDGAEKDGFVWGEFKSLWPVSRDLIWTNGIGLVLSQLDRVFISGLMSVASLGIYTVGVAGGRLLGMAYTPFLQAVYPQTCQLALDGDKQAFADHLARNGKAIMVVCMAVGMPLVFFSRDVLEVWIGNNEVVEAAAAILSLYTIGAICIAYASVFYQGEMALGATRYGAIFNSLALVWFPAMMVYLIKAMGLVGAAWTWLLYGLLSLGYHLIVAFVVLLPQRPLRLLAQAAGLTTGIGLSASYLAWLSSVSWFPDSLLVRVAIAGLGSVITFSGCYLVSFGVRLPKGVELFIAHTSPRRP